MSVGSGRLVRRCTLCHGKGFGLAGKRPFRSVITCPHCDGSGKELSPAQVKRQLREWGINPDSAWKQFKREVLKTSPNDQAEPDGQST